MRYGYGWTAVSANWRLACWLPPERESLDHSVEAQGLRGVALAEDLAEYLPPDF